MAVHISHHMPVYQTATPSPATAAPTIDAYPSHYMSFFDSRQDPTRPARPPLKWRSGLPPSASQSHHHHHHHHHHNHLAKGGVYTGEAIQAYLRPDSIEDVRYEMNDHVKSMVWANHDMLKLRPSRLEPGQKGVFVAALGGNLDVPPLLASTSGEHLHIHPDGTAHMVLSLADAATAVDCGWAEAVHSPGSGLPLGHVTVHAPRDMLELVEWKKLVLASVRFCTYEWFPNEVRKVD